MSYPFFGQSNQPTTSVPPMAPQPQSAPQFNNQQYLMQSQTLFPQPTGSVYNLQTASDIGNIPAGIGISVGLCLQENIMYIKALQNGSPMILGYRLIPIEGHAGATAAVPDTSTNYEQENKRLIEVIKGHDEKIQLLENQLVKIKEKVGGKTEWQL